MVNLKDITKTLNMHLLAYHKDKAEIWDNLKTQDRLNKQLSIKIEKLDKRVKTLEDARVRQILLNKELAKPIKQNNWLSDIINKIKS